MPSAVCRGLVLGLSLALILPDPARAMIAVSLFRPPLRHAAEAAARCPDIRDGRYLVHLRIDGEGRAHDVELREAPEGITLWTEECVERAFEAERFPAAARGDRREGGIALTFPFVVAGRAAPRP
jgi:hypothetical protein